MPEGVEQISVVCTCGKKLKAPASAVGKKAKCPKCGMVLTVSAPVPTPAAVEEDLDAGLYDLAGEGEQSAKPQANTSMAAATGAAVPACLNCQEAMIRGAVVCPKCGWDLR